MFSHEKTIQYKGQKAALYLSETAVSISRAAKPKRPENGKRKITKGVSVKCRLIVSKIQDDKGNILAWWYLLTNVESICMSVIAQWYYWRWSIGVSRLRTLHLVGESPTEVKDSSLVAWEASWRESKTMEPSDNILRKEYAQCTRL